MDESEPWIDGAEPGSIFDIFDAEPKTLVFFFADPEQDFAFGQALISRMTRFRPTASYLIPKISDRKCQKNRRRLFYVSRT